MTMVKYFVGVFSRGEEEPEPTLRAALLATTIRVEHQDQRGPLGTSGASSSTLVQPYKRRFDYDKPTTAQDPSVIDTILKSLNDLKSEVGIIKK